jgi:hypothetical protein
MLELALAMTTSWPVYSGADPELIAHARDERDDDLEERVGNAIEIAIISQAKRFIKSSACQKVIDGIWMYVLSNLMLGPHKKLILMYKVARLYIRRTVVVPYYQTYDSGE